jgi:hypothetical protein
MTTLIEAARQALEALSYVMSHGAQVQIAKDVLRQAIEQAEQQEPVAYVTDNYSRDGVNDEISVFLPVGTTIYTSPPPCQPLTDEIKDAFYEGFTSVETYNDTNLVDVDDAWKKYKAAHGIKG